MTMASTCLSPPGVATVTPAFLLRRIELIFSMTGVESGDACVGVTCARMHSSVPVDSMRFLSVLPKNLTPPSPRISRTQTTP
jgi:hypothetical protein